VLGDKRIKHDLLPKKIALAFYLAGTSINGIESALEICFGKNSPLIS
jgi:hypothetical protein